jgi:hypothetical protein
MYISDCTTIVMYFWNVIAHFCVLVLLMYMSTREVHGILIISVYIQEYKNNMYTSILHNYA